MLGPTSMYPLVAAALAALGPTSMYPLVAAAPAGPCAAKAGKFMRHATKQNGSVIVLLWPQSSFHVLEGPVPKLRAKTNVTPFWRGGTRGTEGVHVVRLGLV